MTSLILVSAGLSLIIWRKTISQVLYKLQSQQMKFFFGKLINYEAPWVPRFFLWWVVILGILLLIGAYATFFRPIYIGN